MNHYPADNVVFFVNTCPLDSDLSFNLITFNNVLFSSCCCLHWIFKFSNFSSIFSIFLLVSRLRAGELSEPLGFLVSSPIQWIELSSLQTTGAWPVGTVSSKKNNFFNNCYCKKSMCCKYCIARACLFFQLPENISSDM